MTTIEVPELLLVEDNPGDVGLIKKALDRLRIVNRLHVVADGEEAMDFLRRRGDHCSAPRPGLILLDLNLPKKDGREVLAEIKADPVLRAIPVIVLTSSEAETDVVRSYQLHANSFITKPPTLKGLQEVLLALHHYWFAIVKRPSIRGHDDA